MNERRGEAWPGPHSQQGLCIIPAISGSITNYHRLSKLIRYRLSWVCRLAGRGQVALAWGLVPFLSLERCGLLDQWGLLGHHPPHPAWSPWQLPDSQPAHGPRGACPERTSWTMEAQCPFHVPLFKEWTLRLDFLMGGI